MNIKKSNWLGLLFLLVFVVSCSKSGPETAKVGGTVLVDDQPLPLGKIIFSSEQGRQSIGKIVEGEIEGVTTFSDGDGAIVGQSRVAIRPTVDESIMMRAPAEAARTINKVGIPREYFSTTTTKLSYEIKSGEQNILDISISTEVEK